MKICTAFIASSRSAFFQEVTFSQKGRHFCWCNLKIRPAPIITSKNFRKNKAGFLKQFELHRLSRAGIFSIISQFWWYHLKLDLPLLSQAEIFAKIPQIQWSRLNIWTAPIIKNKAVLMMPLENLIFKYYHEVKHSLK